MATILFDKIIFGPVHSRRLGVSLGVNLLPLDGKVCNFDCIYCECGLNSAGKGSTGLPSMEQVYATMRQELQTMKTQNAPLDVITFAGNGEPTLHPKFAEIIDFTLILRNEFYPKAQITVLSNATRLDRPSVFQALLKVDQNIQKLDSVIHSTYQIINQSNSGYSIAERIEWLKKFQGKVIIQILFLRARDIQSGELILDNTSPQEVEALVEASLAIRPKELMIYSIDRDTPTLGLEKIDAEELQKLACEFEKKGVKVQVSA